MRKAHYY